MPLPLPTGTPLEEAGAECEQKQRVGSESSTYDRALPRSRSPVESTLGCSRSKQPPVRQACPRCGCRQQCSRSLGEPFRQEDSESVTRGRSRLPHLREIHRRIQRSQGSEKTTL